MGFKTIGALMLMALWLLGQPQLLAAVDPVTAVDAPANPPIAALTVDCTEMAGCAGAVASPCGTLCGAALPTIGWVPTPPPASWRHSASQPEPTRLDLSPPTEPPRI